MSQTEPLEPIRAQAQLHHDWFLGLQLAIASALTPEETGEWSFRLFRRQHLAKFLSSFDKLGLSHLPHAVACAKYHVLSNNMGGVGVEFMAETDQKAWVRFRYPRWMYHGPVLCGVPPEVSRGFLRGWYAHNGVSLGNPRLGYVCVSEDLTGEFGLCGYFREYDHDLAEEERLQFAKDELPPPFDPDAQPQPPADQWEPLRLEKANRNYALEYVRNGLSELLAMVGTERATEISLRASRLIGLQCFQSSASTIGASDGDLDDAAGYLASMFAGMGDATEVRHLDERVEVTEHGLRVVRGLDGKERALVLACWTELWRGTLASQRQLKSLHCEDGGDHLTWRITPTRHR